MMKKFIFLTFILTLKSWGAADDKLLYPVINDPRFCESAVEFKKSFEFFNKEKELEFTQPQAIKASIDISKNCTGAFDRFSKIFLLLKKSGVDLAKAFEVSLEYSSFDEERAKNFFVLFQKLFLENHLNLDFTTAYRLSNELSKDYKGDPVKLRDDFVKIVDFCEAEKEMALDKKTCAELALTLTKYTELFPTGVFDDFQSTIKYVQTHKRLGFNIKETLKLVVRLIARGPKASTNFKKIMTYALEGDALKLNELQAYQLAVLIADLSFDASKGTPLDTLKEKATDKNKTHEIKKK